MIEPFMLEDEAVRIHLVLQCENCDWKSNDHLRGDEAARKHVDQNKHIVSGEYGLSVKFKHDR